MPANLETMQRCHMHRRCSTTEHTKCGNHDESHRAASKDCLMYLEQATNMHSTKSLAESVPYFSENESSNC